MKKSIPMSYVIITGFMLFALFFGAGNLIFPALLGQSSGTNVLTANLGFIITGVGLPLLGILAFAISGKNDLQDLASRVHPIFGYAFTIILYLSIGPLFAMPRTGTVSYEIGIQPFLSSDVGPWPLIIYSILFFGITCFFSLKPAKIVDIVGKYLTPALLLFIAILIITVLVNPIGSPQEPTEAYNSNAFFKGFQEGYLTMDTLAAFVFGIIVINSVKNIGITDRKSILGFTWKAGLIAAALLALIYTSISYLGATSVAGIGLLDNGGAVLADVSEFYYGSFGNVLLGLIVLGACLTTSIGLVTACSSYFSRLFPKVSYTVIAVVLSVFSAVISNAGLANIIAFSVPVLTIIYPLAIVLIFLTFLHDVFGGSRAVYLISLLFTFVVSLMEGLNAAKLPIPGVQEFLTNNLPMYSLGLGWLIPAIIGAVIGYVIYLVTKPSQNELRKANAR
ncbi:branched-chain amino acid transport system II carrier protein [Terribacillus saccharophilus]|uniref:branched-chain amino acid transport system II carrier protein n=1 Tax=Terribacillus saccharophilus TaxID=361277 RepID=UPI000BA752C2|nr:branched-chain amino acid transport system II carrier protein [Terribacillus saccharophilus]PAF22398.1 branched-chain amino acid transport system II carrier protein [Terribacillus saccharophilus]PAF34989.1 branched-chain amino acid transport system II carrier protein [Terribacillus saccharophilus]